MFHPHKLKQLKQTTESLQEVMSEAAVNTGDGKQTFILI